MKAKKISVVVFAVLFIVFAVISTITYNKSESVNIICFEGSFTEEYAEEHNLDYELISDSDAYLGILNLENFEYNYENGKGEIVSYSGDSEKIAIPEDIEGNIITKVTEKAFENAKNLKTVYLPKSIETFEPESLDGVTVYLYEDTKLYKTFLENKDIKIEYKTIADSYWVDFYSANIPFSYDNISDKTIEINRYHAFNEIVFVPESIDGKVVTAISFDVLSRGIETIVIPESVTTINSDLYSDRYDLTFLIGVLIAFVGTVLAVIFASSVKISSKEELFLNIPQFRLAFIAQLVSLALAVVYLYIDIVPDLIIYILFALVFGFSVIAIFKAKAAAALVEGVDNDVQNKTLFIKSVTAKAETLKNQAQTEEMKSVTKKVYEALRYSDPMSDFSLEEINLQIERQLASFETAVNADDIEVANSTADELLILIDSRNKKSKLSK